MQLRGVLWIILMAFGLNFLGCAGTSEKARSENQTLMSLKPVKGHIKKVAIVQNPTPKTDFEKRAGILYFNALAETIQEEASRLQLLTPGDSGFPNFMMALPSSGGAVNVEALALAGRQGGFNGLITTALRDVRPMVERTGVLWFRKAKYHMEFEVTLELYDPITGAKILSAVEEGSVKINESIYEDYKAGFAPNIEPLDEVIAEVGEEIGELVAETLAAHPWQTTVARVEKDRIYLTTGQQAGLQVGQRLAVIKGGRTMEGYQDETFIVPGLKIGEIVITAVSDQMAEAIIDTPGKIEAGDIALPVKR